MLISRTCMDTRAGIAISRRKTNKTMPNLTPTAKQTETDAGNAQAGWLKRALLRSLLAMLAAWGWLTPPDARAGWTAISLHPVDGNITSSEATSVAAGQVGGNAAVNGVSNAAVWNGASPAACSLLENYGASIPTGVFGVGGGRQVGYFNAAALWWEAGSRRNFYPVGPTISAAYGISSVWVCGAIETALTASQATLWKLSGDSSEPPVSLQPAGNETPSQALAIMGASASSPGLQCGLIGDRGQRHATLWQGTPESLVDLHPAGAIESVALALAPSLQGGFVITASSAEVDTLHAGVWAGTAESFIDYHPDDPIFTNSRINGLAEGIAVGSAWVGPDGVADGRAFAWLGSKNDTVNLHSYLPEAYIGSRANAVAWVGGEQWVAGWAYNSVDMRMEAMLWVNAVPEPQAWMLAVLTALAAAAWTGRDRRTAGIAG